MNRLLIPSKSILFICDIQEVFRDKIFKMKSVIHSSNALLRVANELNIPSIITTQYAKKFGNTVNEIEMTLNEMKKKASLDSTKKFTDSFDKDTFMHMTFDKNLFSMMTTEVKEALTTHYPNRKTIILCGIESHVCVLQTTIDLIDNGYNVFIPADAVSSQKPYDREIALKTLEKQGSNICTTESIIFQLLKDALHPKFRNCSKIIKERSSAQTETFYDRS